MQIKTGTPGKELISPAKKNDDDKTTDSRGTIRVGIELKKRFYQVG